MMAAAKNLSTQIESTEGKFVYSKMRRISLRPKGSKVVQLGDGTFSSIDTEPVAIEMDSGGARSRLYDPNVPADEEVLRLLDELLERRPDYRTDARYRIEIVGEHMAEVPWQGYESQSVEEMGLTYHALPIAARPNLEKWMKYELDKDDRDQHRIDLINKLYRDLEKQAKGTSTGTVDLS